ncbi:MAG: DUF4837 family protein [Paludibacteraceae bacterium]|nr:DUF4837 family protein [Paludibacteraceae bacterium]
MKKSALFTAFVFGLSAVLTGCGSDGRTLTSATGSIYECLVVMPDHPLPQAMADPWQADNGSAYAENVTSTYKLVAAAMGADMPCMPQVEPYFSTTLVSPVAFDDFLKPTRNILIVDINPEKYTVVKAKVSTDVWSTPQAVYHIQAPCDSAFVNWWIQSAPSVREWFVRQEMSRQAMFYRRQPNQAAIDKLRDKHGYGLAIPEEYTFVSDTALAGDIRIFLCCNDKGPMRRYLVLYSYPYTSSLQFEPDSLMLMRDSVVGRIVSGQTAGSRVGTEYKVEPPISAPLHPLKDDDGGFYGVEIRGLWKLYGGEAMGGPYVSHSRLDRVNARVVTVESFVFAPGQKKRSAMRQAESILYTLQMPDELKAKAD